LSSSLSSSHASPPPSPKATPTTTTDGRRLNKEQSLSTNNVRSVLSGSPVPAINLHEVRKKDQISLKEKDQKAIKKIRTASLNRQPQPQQQQQHQTSSLISPRVDKGRLKGACSCVSV
jgi:PIN domain nuclease of toxin-antitoxin system